MLASYLPPMFATLAGAALTVAAGGLTIGERRGWVLGVVAAVGVLAFLTAEHGMLVAWILGAAVLVFLAGKGKVVKEP